MRTILHTTVLLLFLYLLGLNPVFSQDLIVTGIITEKANGNPIPGASIINLTNNSGVVSDAFGRFVLRGLNPGKIELSVSYLGFEKFTKTYDITGSEKILINLEKTTFNLSQVSIKPSLTEQAEVVSGIDRLMRPVNSAQDLLNLVPGLVTAQHAGGGKAEQIFLRGFDSDHGTDFNISVDGMPVNMVSHAHGQGYADFHFVIPETIEKFNVYKGPYKAAFGDFSTSGTGEFFTKNKLENNFVKAEYGIFDTYRTVGMFKLPENSHLIKKWNDNAYIAAEYVFTNSYFNQEQNFSRYNFFGKYNAQINSDNLLTISASTFGADWDASGQIPQRAVDNGLIDRFGSINPTEGGATKRTNVNAILSTSASNAVIKNQVYYVKYDFDLFSDFTFFLNDPINGDEINQRDDRNILGYNGTYKRDYIISGKNLHTTFGAGTRNDFTQIVLRSAKERVILDTIVSGKVYQQNSNAFADFTYDLTNKFSVNIGSRIDFFHFRFDSQSDKSISGNKSVFRVSPKLNFLYSLNENIQLFVKSGIGFHSNDARSVVVNKINNSLPKAYGSEVGGEFKIAQKLVLHSALWALYLERELVYIGDEGTVETNSPTQRIGVDLSLRYQLTKNFFADVDFNLNRGRLTGFSEGENYIPLAPQITSIGGISYNRDLGFNASLRYRHIGTRPANENNTIKAQGYFLADAVISYKLKKAEFGMCVENILNAEWNQAQFATESRLFNESSSVEELHFTPGTPLFIKASIKVTL